jgi:large subunit ribosomal protein L22
MFGGIFGQQRFFSAASTGTTSQPLKIKVI